MARSLSREENTVLQTRVPTRIIEKLDDQAQALGLSRAAFVRILLEQSLGENLQLAVLAETYNRLAPIIARSMPQALHRAYTSLPDILREELAKTEEGRRLIEEGWSPEDEPAAAE